MHTNLVCFQYMANTKQKITKYTKLQSPNPKLLAPKLSRIVLEQKSQKSPHRPKGVTWPKQVKKCPNFATHRKTLLNSFSLYVQCFAWVCCARYLLMQWNEHGAFLFCISFPSHGYPGFTSYYPTKRRTRVTKVLTHVSKTVLTCVKKVLTCVKKVLTCVKKVLTCVK